MKPELAKRIIDESGVETLKASWFGESLLSPYFKEIILYAKEKGLKIFLFTNGSLIDKDMAKFLNENVDKVFISIDDIEEKYEKIRVGLKYNDVKKAIELMPNAILTAVGDGLAVKIAFPNHQVNVSKMINRYAPPLNNKVICKHNVLDRLVVGYDGRCYLCCEDWLGVYFIGDLNYQTVDNIWEGKLRKDYLNKLAELPICQNCSQ